MIEVAFHGDQLAFADLVATIPQPHEQKLQEVVNSLTSEKQRLRAGPHSFHINQGA